MAAASTNIGISLGQFLMAEDVSQAGLIAFHLKKLDPHDVIMVRKVLEENWEDEEQMVSNLLQYPFLIPEDMRMASLKRGMDDFECPYYTLSSAVGLQRLDAESGKCSELTGELKRACLHDIGMVAMRAFITLHPHLKLPEDGQFITGILKQPKSTLFQNALTWLLIEVKDKNEMMELLNGSNVTAEVKLKAERFIDEQLNMRNNKGEDQSFSLQFVNYIPSLNDFEAMLDKQETLSDFFVDLDTNRDGKVSLSEVQSFLEDIGKETSLEELEKDAQSIELDVNGNIDKDTFIEIMFPRFQMK